MSFEHNNSKAIELLEEAVAIDTEFAMAYRKLGVVLSNEGRPSEESDSALARAYRHREHLPDRERYLTIGSYFQVGPGRDRVRAKAAFEAELEIDSTDEIALTNLALVERSRREFARAEQIYRRLYAQSASANDSADDLLALVSLQLSQSKLADAESTLAKVRAAFPRYDGLEFSTATLLYAKGRADSATVVLEKLRGVGSNPQTQSMAMYALGDIAAIHGRLHESEKI